MLKMTKGLSHMPGSVSLLNQSYREPGINVNPWLNTLSFLTLRNVFFLNLFNCIFCFYLLILISNSFTLKTEIAIV
jgi:hypothetical protein